MPLWPNQVRQEASAAKSEVRQVRQEVTNARQEAVTAKQQALVTAKQEAEAAAAGRATELEATLREKAKEVGGAIGIGNPSLL